MRIYTVLWLYAQDMEIDILATLVENFDKCPPLDQFLDTRLLEGEAFVQISTRSSLYLV